MKSKISIFPFIYKGFVAEAYVAVDAVCIHAALRRNRPVSINYGQIDSPDGERKACLAALIVLFIWHESCLSNFAAVADMRKNSNFLHPEKNY